MGAVPERFESIKTCPKCGSTLTVAEIFGMKLFRRKYFCFNCKYEKPIYESVNDPGRGKP